MLGGFARTGNGVYAVAFASRGSASAGQDPKDASGRGWAVTAKWNTHQVAVSILKDRSTAVGTPVYLTSDPAVDHVNVRLAAVGPDRFLVTWENVTGAKCKDGTCLGTFAGSQRCIVDSSGKPTCAVRPLAGTVAGDLAVAADGTVLWAYAAGNPPYAKTLTGKATTDQLTLAALTVG